MKRQDFRDALRLIVLQLAKRFRVKMNETELDEYVDDLMHDLPPKSLAQLPALLAKHRRDGQFMPSTGEIRAQVSKPRQLTDDPETRRLLLQAKEGKPPGWEQMTEADISAMSAEIRAASRARWEKERAELPREKRPATRSTLMRLGEGMTEQQFREMLDQQKKKFQDHNRKDGPHESS